MSNGDSSESGDKKVLSGLPGPQVGAVSPLHGGPRPKAAARNPFASSDEIEVQRPNSKEDGDEQQSVPPQAEAAEPEVNETVEATASADSEDVGETVEPVSNPPTRPKVESATSAFREAPPSSGPNVGLIIVGLIAIAAIAFMALR